MSDICTVILSYFLLLWYSSSRASRERSSHRDAILGVQRERILGSCDEKEFPEAMQQESILRSGVWQEKILGSGGILTI